MTITNDIREQVIAEYEKARYLDRCSIRCKTKPLGRAQQYFRLLTRHYRSLQKGWFKDVNERVKTTIRQKYGLTLITELKPEYYDEANECAMKLFEKEIEKSEYYNDKVDYFDLPWIRNRFSGKFVYTRYIKTWDEWKEICRKQVYQ